MRRAAAVLTALLVTACQPAGAPAPGPTTLASEAGLGAPPAGMPQSLDALLERTEPAALEWQDDPRLAELTVDVAEDGRWIAARALYLAADADRSLSLRLSAGGLAQQRPTLATLGLEPVSGEGLEAVPPLPDDAAEPTALLAAAQPLMGDCGATPPATQVLYATGAPVSWDGTAWSVPPEWTATVLDGEASGVVLDPTGAPAAQPCLG